MKDRSKEIDEERMRLRTTAVRNAALIDGVWCKALKAFGWVMIAGTFFVLDWTKPPLEWGVPVAWSQCEELMVSQTGGPAVIPDFSPVGAVVDLPVAVAAGSTVTKVTLGLNITHGSIIDLDIWLISPAGTRSRLVHTICNTHNNMYVTLDDDAPDPVGSNCAQPYTGTYNTGGGLNVFIGENPQGIWKLQIQDVLDMDTGTLDSATLTIDYENCRNTLTLSKTGTGLGTVTSTPSGITCGDDCSEQYSYGTAVSLTATADAGSTFEGWSGACSGTGTCTVTMDNDKTAAAAFTLNQPNQYTITTSANPEGGGSTLCHPNPVISGMQSTCTVTPIAGYHIASVTGTCAGTLSGNTYTTNPVTADCTVIAGFAMTGDCNGDGQVTINEVQAAVNMHLGFAPVTECVDLNHNGVADISEVQIVINNHLK
jgi:subtilisin-like proprotein convertase family protein